MVKMRLEIEFDGFEDRNEIINMLSVPDMLSDLFSIDNEIRSRIKHQDIDDDQVKFLVNIRGNLSKYLEGYC